MSAYYNIGRSDLLPTGNAVAAFTKVAMADQFGRDLAKVAGGVMLIGRAKSAIKGMEASLPGLKGRKLGIQEKRISNIEGRIGKQQGQNKRTYKDPAARKAAGTRATKKTSTEMKTIKHVKTRKGKPTKAAKGLAAHTRAASGKTSTSRGAVQTQKTRVADRAIANASKNRKDTKWYKDERTMYGVAGGLGAGLVGSAILGD